MSSLAQVGVDLHTILTQIQTNIALIMLLNPN